MSKTPLLQVKNLHTSFFTDAGEVKAVNGISYNLDRGRVLGIVGESGSGKSVSAYSLMRILTDTGRVTEGEVLVNGEDILKYSEKQMQSFRGSRISMIFQDPMTCLNPVFTVGDQLRELAALEHPNKEDLAEARRLVDQAGGIAFARNYLESLAVQAVDALSALPEGPHRDALGALVRIVECE